MSITEIIHIGNEKLTLLKDLPPLAVLDLQILSASIGALAGILYERWRKEKESL